MKITFEAQHIREKRHTTDGRCRREGKSGTQNQKKRLGDGRAKELNSIH